MTVAGSGLRDRETSRDRGPADDGADNGLVAAAQAATFILPEPRADRPRRSRVRRNHLTPAVLGPQSGFEQVHGLEERSLLAGGELVQDPGQRAGRAVQPLPGQLALGRDDLRAAPRRADRRQHIPHCPADRRPPQGRGNRGAHHRRGVMAGRPFFTDAERVALELVEAVLTPPRPGSASPKSCTPRPTTTPRRCGRSRWRSARCASGSPSLSSPSRSLVRNRME